MSNVEYEGDGKQRDVRNRLRDLILRVGGDYTWVRIRARLRQAMTADDQHQEAMQPPLEMMSSAARAGRDMAAAILEHLLREPSMLLPKHGISDAALKSYGDFVVEPAHLQTDTNRVVILPQGWGYEPAGEHTYNGRILNPEGSPVLEVISDSDGGIVRSLLPPLELSHDNP